ncbi:MAG: ethylbenzene dehydrogenase-related protein [Campylobacterota bacterium]|nr:ethylbenzene dehydrogenase-related protein [Campylobacterota bacterium]
MKKAASSIIAAGVVATSVMAADAAITASKVDADLSRISYSSKIWANTKFSDVVLYPQTTIRQNDKKANEINANNKAKKAEVAAVYNGTDIAFMIKWADATMNIQTYNPEKLLTSYKSDQYSDGFAVQFAADGSDVERLPYIGMGSEGRPVVVHLQKAAQGVFESNGDGNVYYQLNRNQTELFGDDLATFDRKVKNLGSNDYERTFISEGFRSMTEIKDSSSDSHARLGYKAGSWMGTLSRPLQDEYANLDSGAVPVAFAVWDGEKLGRDGIKNISQWVSVKLDGKPGGEALITALAEKASGDAAKGKEAVAVNGCVGCHQVEETDAPNLMGPTLSNIGGYNTAAYLRESLKAPSAVVVPGYNRNAHSNYMWYTEENGKRTSTMTDYSWLDDETLNDIVAYLQTLKAEVE